MKNLKIQIQTYFQKKDRNIFLVLLTGFVVAISQSATAAAPKITKSFNPASITANDFVTLSIAFSNPNSDVATFTAPFTERLPTGMVIIGTASTSCGGTLIAEPGNSKLTLADAKIPAYGACAILLGVTASRPGSFDSKTPVAALQTDNGNNSATSDATLTVTKPVPMDLRIRKSFNPTSIKLNEYTTLSIALSNPNKEVARLAVPFSDYLPDGMIILGSASTTCDGELTAKLGASKIILADAKIPAYGACEILLGVTAAEPKNRSTADLLQTDLGNSTEQSMANITVD